MTVSLVALVGALAGAGVLLVVAGVTGRRVFGDGGSLLGDAGLALTRWWTDAAGDFGVSLSFKE